MQTPKPKRRFESRPLADLRPHPRQAELFGEGSDHEIEELAADIRKNGVIHPIEVTSDGTIIAGHRRVKALRHLQRIQVHCWVREDLEQLGENAVEQRLIEDNLNRRQMSRLEQARAYRRLKALQYSGNTETGEAVDGDLRDFLATRFDTSGRTLDRWSRVLDTPPEIQKGVELHMLTLNQGTKVADLPRSTQREMAERIRQGKDPKEVFANYLGTPPVRKSSAEVKIAKLVRAIDDCDSVGDELSAVAPASSLTLLKKASHKLQELLRTIESKQRRGKQRPQKQTKQSDH
ncbi:MAG TPA: hypothetical protein DD670_13530 [Planctomycetaceae bacterium]|nr:hypothetical protein [Planctomycetaceae bacterium]